MSGRSARSADVQAWLTPSRLREASMMPVLFCAKSSRGELVQPLRRLSDNICNMMMRHRRWPAILVLAVMVGLGALYVRSWGKGSAGSGEGIAALEKQIGQGNVPAATWNTYAQKLMEVKRFDDAATAYRKVLDKEPGNRGAKTGVAIALAKAKNEEEFYKYMSDMTYTGDAKMAMDIFDRVECQAWLSQTRFKTLQHEARAQAMD